MKVMGIVIKIFVEDNKEELNVVVWNDDTKRNKSTENKSKVVADFKVPLNIDKNNKSFISDDIEWEDCKLERNSNYGDENEVIPEVEDNFIDMNSISYDNNSDPYSDNVISQNIDGKQSTANFYDQVAPDYFVIENVSSFQSKSNTYRPSYENSSHLMQNCSRSYVQQSKSMNSVRKRMYHEEQNVSQKNQHRFNNTNFAARSFTSQKSEKRFTASSKITMNDLSSLGNHHMTNLNDPIGNVFDGTENSYYEENHSSNELINYSNDFSHMVDVNIEENSEVIEQNITTNFQYSSSHSKDDKSTKKIHYCSECEFSCNAKVKMNAHFKLHQANMKKNQNCRECDFSCDTKTEMKAHRKKHTLPRLTCEICGYQNTNKHNLIVHRKRHRTSAAYTCSYCGYICSKQYFLPLHERIHTGEKAFSCSFCEYKCRQKGTLNAHVKNKHEYELHNTSYIKPYPQITSS